MAAELNKRFLKFSEMFAWFGLRLRQFNDDYSSSIGLRWKTPRSSQEVCRAGTPSARKVDASPFRPLSNQGA
jgi:hypothetical protein